MSWTDEKVQKLKELWKKGHTASQIAEMLGDTTRNAVIGKAHRLNLSLKFRSKKNLPSNFIKSKNPVEKQNLRKDRKSKFKSLIIENPKSLEELSEDTCKWPIGHPNEESFYFCGRKPEEDFPYCKLHVLYAFQPKGQKEDVLDKDDEVPEFIEKKVKSSA